MFWFNTARVQYPDVPVHAVVMHGVNRVYIDAEQDLIVVWRWIDGRAANEVLEAL